MTIVQDLLQQSVHNPDASKRHFFIRNPSTLDKRLNNTLAQLGNELKSHELIVMKNLQVSHEAAASFAVHMKTSQKQISPVVKRTYSN
jgi:hypothetical protein